MSHTRCLPHRLAPNRRFSERKRLRLVPFTAFGVYDILFAILTTLHMVVKQKKRIIASFSEISRIKSIFPASHFALSCSGPSGPPPLLAVFLPCFHLSPIFLALHFTLSCSGPLGPPPLLAVFSTQHRYFLLCILQTDKIIMYGHD